VAIFALFMTLLEVKLCVNVQLRIRKNLALLPLKIAGDSTLFFALKVLSRELARNPEVKGWVCVEILFL